MAAKSNFTNMVLCLFVTCLFCSAVLAVVYAVTKAPIEQTNAQILKDSIGKVLPEGCEISPAMPLEVGGQPSEYYRADKGAEIVGFAVKSTVVGFGGKLTIIVGILADGTVNNTSVYECNETPGLGAKCQSDEKFIAQWSGFDPSVKKLAVKKDGGDVDAITASTITSRAYTLAVKNAVLALEKLAQTPMLLDGDSSTGASVANQTTGGTDNE